MNLISRSRYGMTLLAAGAAFYALGSLCAVIAFATLSANNESTFVDLGHATDWLRFTGTLGLLAGVGAVVWTNLNFPQKDQLVELGVALVATLLISVASLVTASSSSSHSAADVVGAIGVGLWAMLVFSRAARYNLADQATGATSSLASLWLLASGALVLLAIGSGFDVGLTDQGLGIAQGILEALGVGGVALVLITSRSKGMLMVRSVETATVALLLLAAGFVASAVVSGIVFTPHGTLKGLRIGVSITIGIEAIATVGFVFAAWQQVGQLVRSWSSMNIVGIPPHGPAVWQPGVPLEPTPSPGNVAVETVPPPPPPPELNEEDLPGE